MRPHETIRGRLLDTSAKPERDNAERGREFVTITKHSDGRRTVRAHCEIDDEPNVLRDVTLTLDKNWITRDAFVRLSVGDKTSGSSWYKFEDTYAECAGWVEGQGRIAERVEYASPPELFGAHPILGDALHLWSIDTSMGPTVKILDRFLMSSLDHRGATGPSLVWHEPGMRIEYLGEERITVGAGTFDARHYCYGESAREVEGTNEFGKHPNYHMWTTADEDRICLKAHVTGYMMTRYELMELERVPAES